MISFAWLSPLGLVTQPYNSILDHHNFRLSPIQYYFILKKNMILNILPLSDVAIQKNVVEYIVCDVTVISQYRRFN